MVNYELVVILSVVGWSIDLFQAWMDVNNRYQQGK